MNFNGNEGEFITLKEGTEWASNFRQRNPGAIKANYIGKNKLQSVLDQDNCVGVRVYNAIDNDNKPCIIIVGVNSEGEDLYNGYLLERSLPCPPYCPDLSPLKG